MEQSSDNKMIPMTSFASGTGHEIRNDLYYYTNQIVNVIFVGEKGSRNWVLVDAGMPKSGEELIKVAEERFGKDNPPQAIVLTHGHFDHVGSIVSLLEKWHVPVYAHPLEMPYLSGERNYPEPDATVQGGLLAKMSAIYPYKAINIAEALHPLPEDHSVPGMPGWEWIHTPEHTRGHVSFFRKSDKTLIAGDAFVTVRTDSFYKVLVQEAEVNGPPRYFTSNWDAARSSVETLHTLAPEMVITGHGPVMEGKELKDGLQELVDEFDYVALPSHGKYVDYEQEE
jgi:glyoxylase-like metal-dependent hydrolase (beta-lactamase superfamily II)